MQVTITLFYSQVPSYMVSQERRDWRDYKQPEQQPLPSPHHHGPHADLQYGQCHYPSPISRAWSGSHTENGKLSVYLTWIQHSKHIDTRKYDNNAQQIYVHCGAIFISHKYYPNKGLFSNHRELQ